MVVSMMIIASNTVKHKNTGGKMKMEEDKPTMAKRKDLSDLLNHGSVFGMGFSDKGNYELSRGKQYKVSNCFRPCDNRPGPCICYGRQKK